MSTADLGTYLQDHYAGSVAAVELLDHLISTFAGEPFEIFFSELRTDIIADQNELSDLMRALGVQESGVRNAGAWMVVKFSQIKLGLAGEKQGGLGLLQALEALVLGITGKHLLWRGLAGAMESSAQLPPIDFARLERRALEQRDRVEAKRLEAAQQVLTSG
jgi:hypothetical protein